MFCLEGNATAALGTHRATAVGVTWVASKSGGLNGRQMPEKYLQSRNILPYRSHCAGRCGRRPFSEYGKAEILWEETGKSTMEATAAWGQASTERDAEITSGRTTSQQGLVATCKDPPYKVKPKAEERDVVWRMGPYERRGSGNALLSSGKRCSRSVTPDRGQRDPGRLAVAGDPRTQIRDKSNLEVATSSRANQR